MTPDQTGHHCDKLRPEQVLAWISDGCALFDEELRCCFINAPASALFGQSPESLIAKNLRTEFPAFGVPPFLQLVDDVVASRSPRHVELRDIPTGRLFDVRLYPSSAGLLVLIADAATDRNSLLEQTARADFLQRLVDQMPAIVWVVDRNLRIQRFEGGKIVLAALGHDLIGLQMEDVRVMGVMKPNELEEQIELHRKALRGIASEYRANWDGMALEARVQPLRDPDGEIIGILGIAIDVTEQMQMQEKLRQSQKLEALGQLAGGVAHDFNNVLAAISGYAQLLHDDTPPGDPHREDLAEILKAAERAAAITRQLLAFSRRQALAAERLDLLVVVHDLSRMMRALLPASIDLQVSPSGGNEPVWVLADRGQLEQLIMNLVLNARDAMPAGGALSIAVSTATAPDNVRTAFLVVRDNGVGMSADVQARMFEPFFTTKEPGRGTGLGLATVYGIVRQYDGSILIASDEGMGTTVTVGLPRADDGASAALLGTVAPVSGSDGRILVVDDEASVREVTARILRRAGYEVATAADATEALRMLATSDPFDLVLTDSALPGMHGQDLAEEIGQRYPRTRVILMSGYSELTPSAVPRARPSAIASFVQKPYKAAQLLDEVRRVIERG